MARYIDAEELLEEIKKLNWNDDVMYHIVKVFIEDAPTADVVEVVRCERCKHGDVSIISKSKDGNEDIACYCNLKKVVTDVDSYCPSGQRKQKNDFKEKAMDNKLNPKRNCYHYKCSKCSILVNDGRYLNCQIHKCSFFETKEEYEKRQDEAGKRMYERYTER